MVRPLRLSFKNAFYHITARGNRREKIFYSDRDKEIFLNKLDETLIALWLSISLSVSRHFLYLKQVNFLRWTIQRFLRLQKDLNKNVKLIMK